MSLQAQLINSLALLSAVAGGWLLVVTRWRQQGALLRSPASPPRSLDDARQWCEATARVNGFFYRLGSVGLGLAVLLSWFSGAL